jgi:hypothetical protein
MGAWGVGAFENDEAADWSIEFRTADLRAGLSMITDPLTLAAKPENESDLLDGSDGTMAVAAAELVAAINGHPIDESVFNEDARQWIARVRPCFDPDLTSLAFEAMSRVLGPTSVLAELWFPENADRWRSAMAALRSKLGPGQD